ncbi:MAG: amino acid adenylation domain-containing protein [Syntrophobacteraceae bacterium]
MQINVVEYFEKTLECFPEKTGVMDAVSSYTFSQMATRAKYIAAMIVAKVNARNNPIAVYLPKACDAVISILGVLLSGNLYMPIDIKFPQLRIQRILENIRPSLVITNNKLAHTVEACGFPMESILVLDAESPSPSFPDISDSLNVWRSIIDTDPAYIINTSGSTGIPKGVVISHRSIIDYIDWAILQFGLKGDLVIGNQAPFCFDASTPDIYLSWALGGTLVLIPEDLFTFPVKLMQFVADKEVTLISWVPSVLINVANMKILDKVRLPKLDKVLFIGEVMPNKHLNYWRRHLQHALFANLYGPTEITFACTYYLVEREFRDEESLPIGFPCRNSDILILNSEGELCETNEQGELCVRGTSLALGYWNDPDKTAKAFVQNPLNKHYPELIYRTGDLVYRNELNEIIFVGRKDFQIKHLGYRIELGEIESAIYGIDGIENVCVLYNDEKAQITLFYECDHELKSADIRQKLAAVLPKYMQPTIFFQMEAIPLTTTGKIDRQSLEGLMLDGL